jgi:hypothetical protein
MYRRLAASRRSPVRLAGAGVGLVCVLAAVVATSATAHLCCYTGETTWHRTLAPGQANIRTHNPDGSGGIFYHSYAFQSATNLSGGDRRVCSSIAFTPTPPDRTCNSNFTRVCTANWYHGGSHLNCHDQDGTAYGVVLENASGATTTIEGHPLR